MREIILGLLLISGTQMGTYAQTNLGSLETIDIDGHSYIDISLKNLVYLQSLSEREWKQVIVALDFDFISDENGVIIYVKGSLGGKSQTVVKDPENEGSAVFWYNFDSKQELGAQFRATLKDYFKYVDGEYRYHYVPYKGKKYRIGVLVNDVVMEEYWVITL